MTQKACHVLVFALSLGILPLATAWAGAQEAGEKNPPEKSVAERSTTERGSSSYYPQRSELAPPVELRPVSRRITLKLTDDSRAIYESIGQQAGIDVLFDPDYTSRRISVDLSNASLEDALQTAAFQSRSFWRPVTSNSILVAADNATKRHELEPQVIKTFYLPNFSQATDFQDTVNLMRALLQIDRVQQLVGVSTIIARGTPDQLALSQKLINDLSEARKKAGEYRLEFRISELEGERKLSSRTYVLLTEPHQKTMLHTGNRVPVQMGSEVSSDKSSSDKKGIEYQYLDVGQSIDCTVVSHTERSIGLSVSLELSNVALQEKAGDQVAPSVRGQPVLQQVKTAAMTAVELGKPTLIFGSDVPGSTHSIQIEVTATRVRERD